MPPHATQALLQETWNVYLKSQQPAKNLPKKKKKKMTQYEYPLIYEPVAPPTLICINRIKIFFIS